MCEEVGVVRVKTINDQGARVVLAQFLASELYEERGVKDKLAREGTWQHTSVSFMNAFKMGSV